MKKDIGLLTQHDHLICDSCSSGQCFACGFLQTSSRGDSPCGPANSSPCRVCRGLSPPSKCALAGRTKKKGAASHPIYVNLNKGASLLLRALKTLFANLDISSQFRFQENNKTFFPIRLLILPLVSQIIKYQIS